MMNPTFGADSTLQSGGDSTGGLQPSTQGPSMCQKFFIQVENYDQFSEDELDISNESIAEKKIEKINHKLKKHKIMDKVEKRRLQNRKSALKCRLRKSHLISTLQKEVGELRQERQSFIEQVIFQISLNIQVQNLKDLLKEEKLKNSQLTVEITKLQSIPINPMMYSNSIPVAQQYHTQPHVNSYCVARVTSQQTPNYYPIQVQFSQNQAQQYTVYNTPQYQMM